MLVLLQHQQGSWYLCSTNSYLKLRDYMADEEGFAWMLVLFQHQQCSWYLFSTNKHNVHMFSNVFLRVLNIYR